MTPGFTVVALLVLTLSIGVLTAIFSLVDAFVLRSLPFEASDRLVAAAMAADFFPVLKVMPVIGRPSRSTTKGTGARGSLSLVTHSGSGALAAPLTSPATAAGHPRRF